MEFQNNIENEVNVVGPNNDISGDPSSIELSLSDINKELDEIIIRIQNEIDLTPSEESRLDKLVQMRDKNEEYQELIRQERIKWRNDNSDWLEECLRLMRSFIPLNIHAIDEKSLRDNYNYTEDLSRRFKRKECLWLLRMHEDDISRIHEADLYGRYSHNGLDLVEMSALYQVLPSEFTLSIDVGKKYEWAQSLELTLKSYLKSFRDMKLSKDRSRNKVYQQWSEIEGPIKDTSSVRSISTIVSNAFGRRTSYLEVCAEHSILAKIRRDKEKEHGASVEGEKEVIEEKGNVERDKVEQTIENEVVNGKSSLSSTASVSDSDPESESNIKEVKIKQK